MKQPLIGIIVGLATSLLIHFLFALIHISSQKTSGIANTSTIAFLMLVAGAMALCLLVSSAITGGIIGYHGRHISKQNPYLFSMLLSLFIHLLPLVMALLLLIRSSHSAFILRQGEIGTGLLVISYFSLTAITTGSTAFFTVSLFSKSN
jgi:hypothetical protein